MMCHYRGAALAFTSAALLFRWAGCGRRDAPQPQPSAGGAADAGAADAAVAAEREEERLAP